ncbi:ferritin-like domain-containing protein [Pseudomonas sp. NPDC089530]|uniref:ferritin-like domain-containing protein n=1 Tax=Pseudomonas sp. NPDC089530 TaxID=3390651 RepID=UPI003D068BA9
MSLEQQKAQIFPLLQTAMELELSTIPPYLTALLSLKREKNRVSANLIRSVMMEEMLHMVLVGNLVSSLGGKISLGPDNIPGYPLRMEFEGKAFKDRKFDVDLAAFSAESIQTFLQIELPADLARRERLLTQERIAIPELTIGDFYQSIITMLETLCATYPPSQVFCGDPGKQINEQFYWGGAGKPIVITGMDTAREALQTIIEQGEGADMSVFDLDLHYFDQPEEVAHYFRFKEIAEGRRYRPGDKPSEPPSGERFEVDYNAVFPIIRNPKHSDYPAGSRLAHLNRSFNQQYSLMLQQLEQAFNGHPAVLYDAIINGMHGFTPIAQEMMETPISDKTDARHGAPSFEWISPPTS